MSKKNKILSWVDLSRVLAKESSSEEEKRVEEWKDASSTHKSAFHQSEAIWNSVDEEHVHLNIQTDELWLDLKKRIESGKPTVTGPVKKSFYHLKVWMYSAAAIFLIGLFLMRNSIIDTLRYEKTIVTTFDNQDIKLSDGTAITLCKNSKFRYAKHLKTSSQRLVNLEGQAFFDVAKDPKHPFIIYTSDVKIKVLGTSFNVKTQPSGSVEITVVTGKVALITPIKGTYDTLLILPGHIATYKKDSKEAALAMNNDVNFLSWKTNKYVYNDTPIKNVVNDLSYQYNIDIELKNPKLGNCKFTGTFENNTINQILKVLSYTMNLDYDVVDNTKIILDGEGCGMN